MLLQPCLQKLHLKSIFHENRRKKLIFLEAPTIYRRDPQVVHYEEENKYWNAYTAQVRSPLTYYFWTQWSFWKDTIKVLKW